MLCLTLMCPSSTSTRNSCAEVVEELSRSDGGKATLAIGAGVTAWAVLFNVKLAFELFVTVIILDQIGSRSTLLLLLVPFIYFILLL